MLEIKEPRQALPGAGRPRAAALDHPGHVVLGRRRRAAHHRRAVGRRQIDAAQHHRADRHRERRRDRVRRRAHRLAGAEGAASGPQPPHRLRHAGRQSAAVAHHHRQRAVSARGAGHARRRGARARRRADRGGRAHGLRALLSARTVRRHAQARGADPHAGLRPADDPDGRAVRRGRRADPHAAAGGPAAAVEPQAQDHHFRHPRHHRGDCARRPRAGADAAAGAHRRRASDPDSAPAQRARTSSPCRASPRSTNASGQDVQ